IQGVTKGIYEVKVIDLSGNQILKTTVTNSKNTIKKKGLSAGMYIIEVIKPNGDKEKISIIKK
ncbi:T9SS type A sorting domain-containing protein, partial [Tenacibaculum agarivorans]|uniref:T9SS type A sorting domain-containing protein n=1 Tax=Tenacibaculum agarivorans TaxID=1908389 RepID=UPI000A4D194D